MSDKPKRGWFQYILATLALITLVSVGLLGWHMYQWQQQQAEQRKASEAVRALGGESQPSFSSATMASAVLERHNADNMFFLDEKNIRDDDLKVLASAEMTRSLHLFKNEITDSGLVHLKNLRHLQFLDLRRNTGITDEGLKQLENLKELEQLVLIGTKVTPAGVSRLQQKLPTTKIAY